ncbi:MAG: thioredoxin-like domain-containing protein, partial [Planctomycetaceae bacterium]
VGQVWKLTQIPRLMTGNTIQVALGGILMRPAQTVTSGAAGTELTPELAALIQSLQKLNAAPPQPDAAPQEVLAFLRKRRSIVLQLVKQSRTTQERETWQRQLINLLASVAQAGDQSGITELSTLEKSLSRQSPQSSLIPYAIYRRQLGTYGLSIRSGNLKQQTAAQEKWLASLEQFVQTFPKSEDAPDALLQLAVNRELSGSTGEATDFFTQLAGRYADTPQGKRATGAIRRLQLTGKEMPLSGTDLSGQTVNAGTYRGKLLLIVFWASWSGEFEEDVPVLNGLYQQYRAQGFEVVGVNLDPQASVAGPFIQQNKISWTSIFQPGVFDSPLSQQYGILTVPTMFLIGRDGKVIGNNLSLTELKDTLRKQLN